MRIFDVGGGASTLVDDLLGRQAGDFSMLDISASALAVACKRLGASANQVSWLEGDITRVTLPAAHYDIWHDRAVFHSLTDPQDWAAYVA